MDGSGRPLPFSFSYSMRLLHVLCFLVSVTLVSGAVPARKPVAKKGAPVRNSGKAPVRSGSTAKHGTRPAAPPAPPRQQAPSNDRYREIQQALADRGYLKSEPNGV